MINCGHCGGRHPTVAEVRSCSGVPAADSSSPESETVVPAGLGVPDVVLAPDWQRLAGPHVLGRNLLVLPGQAAPTPWADAARITIDESADGLHKLQAARSNREPVVIELAVELPQAHPVLDTDFWLLDPTTDLGGEQLRHLVLDHSVDARDVSHPSISSVSLAVAAGATVRTEGSGDVDTNGGPAWCDGGPLTWFEAADLGALVIPAANLKRGTLRPLLTAAPSADLAPDQLAAVAHNGGGARIIAPAGSGKTRVLTERARHLILDRGIDPSGVCLLAFNVRAREEMQERTTDLDGLEIRTLNSLGLAIQSGGGPFRKPANRARPRVIDEREVRRILDDLVAGRRQAMSDPMAVWIEALTASRLGLRSPASVEHDFGGDVRDFSNVLPEYRRRLRHAGVVDFDEQILGAIDVLCTDPEARAAARRACRVLLVDEFQDLTPAHVLLIRLLAGPEAEVFGVGDDDQTIYGYSGASPEWLIEFADLFPGSGSHDLTINYRCPPEVVQAAATLLTHNRRRIPKDITAKPGRQPDPDGGSLRVASAADPTMLTLDHVSSLLDAGTPPAHIAVLARVNATLLGPMLALADAGIATNAPIELSFLERTGIAGALAWLRLAVAPEQRLSSPDIDMAARRPPRGMSRVLVGWMAEQSSTRDLLGLASRLRKERDQAKVSEFVADLTTLRQLADDGADTAALLTAVRDQVGLGIALDAKLDASRRSVDRSAHGDDLSALLTVARYEPDPTLFPDWLHSRLSTIPTDWNGVRLSTVHRVKGQEWPHVVVHEATAGLFPHRLAADHEEERRVFHVALTRGVSSVLVAAGEPRSPFVAQLTKRADPNAVSAPVPPRSPAGPTQARPKKREVPEASSLDEAQLREQLKGWRLETSRDEGIPAFRIFADTTLYELARLRPTTPTELLAVPGIGPGKVERYGDGILAVVSGG